MQVSTSLQSGHLLRKLCLRLFLETIHVTQNELPNLVLSLLALRQSLAVLSSLANWWNTNEVLNLLAFVRC